jgi:hypothetical protein
METKAGPVVALSFHHSVVERPCDHGEEKTKALHIRGMHCKLSIGAKHLIAFCIQIQNFDV